MYCTLWLTLLLAISQLAMTSALCGNVKDKCCPGKNSTCYGYGKRLSGSGSNSSRCFCDENCLLLQDCCEDIRTVCPASPCRVSTWGEWSECGCGHSQQKRTREIIEKPSFEGASCPPLKEARTCWVRSCKTARHTKRSRSKEIALILPAAYGANRRSYNMRQHYNWNLYHKYWAPRANVPDTSSCATYEVLSQRRSCRYQVGWARSLYPGTRVCVECHPKAMKRSLGFRCNGHGIQHAVTQWSAVRVRGCHGAWRLLEKHRDCSCHRGSNDYIFV